MFYYETWPRIRERDLTRDKSGWVSLKKVKAPLLYPPTQFTITRKNFLVSTDSAKKLWFRVSTPPFFTLFTKIYSLNQMLWFFWHFFDLHIFSSLDYWIKSYMGSTSSGTFFFSFLPSFLSLFLFAFLFCLVAEKMRGIKRIFKLGL